MKERYPVIEGAETFYYQGNEIGVLLSHGFVGTPQSVHYLGRKLAEYGYTVLAPRLPGHGTHYYDLETVTYREWFKALEDAYKSLAKKCSVVFVVGQSMGGTLTLQLADKYPEIKGVATINAALSLPGYEDLRFQTQPRYVSEGEPDIQAKGIKEITYAKVPLQAIQQLQILMAETRKIIPTIKTPALCIKSRVDHVVPPDNTDFIYQSIQSRIKRLVTLPNSYHVASMDNDKDMIISSLHQFIDNEISANLVASY